MKAKLLAHRKERNADGHITELKDWVVPVTEHTPESIKELAAITHRDMKNISEDVKILLDMDLIEMEKHGKNKAPRLHYEGFRLEVAV